MAQSADDRMFENSRSPVDIEVFWPDNQHSPDPPNCWTSWLEGFKIASLAKINIAYDTLLENPTENDHTADHNGITRRLANQKTRALLFTSLGSIRIRKQRKDSRREPMNSD